MEKKKICLDFRLFSFFFSTNDYSFTQTWGGLGNQTGIKQPIIKQPIKQRDLWKDRAFLAKESAISLCILGT